jgi:isopenicillin N synthase-like dioxygenase
MEVAVSEADRIPLIDCAGLREGGRDALYNVASRIGRACRTIGFFYVTSHGVGDALTAGAFSRARDLFSLGPDQKDAVSFFRSPHNRGYIGIGAEALDTEKPADLKEAFNIGLDLEPGDPEVLAGKQFRGVNLWPDIPCFRETMVGYFDAVWSLGRDLHRAFAIDLDLPPDYFDDKLDRPMATLRLLHYPPRPRHLEKGQLGAGEHTDYGNITLLATDDAGGLQVRTRSGDWIEAPVIPGALICNIGDCLMRWTNDVYVSTPHRVVSPSGRDRFSIAFFLDPNPDAIVECLPSCREPSVRPRYEPVRADAFLRSRLDPTYAHNTN